MKSLGLLFEHQKVFLVCLKKGLKGISLYSYRLLSLKEVKPEERDDFIAGGIEAFIEETRAPRKNLFFGIPRDQVVFKYLDMPVAIEENLGNVLQYELDRYTPFTTEDVYLDYRIISRDRERETIKILLVAVKRELLDRYLMILERLNLRPKGAEITSTALFNLKTQGEVKKKISFKVINIQRVKTWFKKKEVQEKGEEEKEKGSLVKRFLSLLSRAKTDKKVSTSQGLNAVSYLDEHYLELNIIQNGMLAYSKVFPFHTPKGTDRIHFLRDRISTELDMAAMVLNGLKEEAIPLVLTGAELDSGLVEELRLAGEMDPHVVNERMIGVKGDKGKDVLSLLSPTIGIAIKGLKEVPLDINLIPVTIRPREIKYLREIIAGVLLLISSIVGGVYYYNAFIEDEAYLDKLTKDVNQLRVEVMAEEKMQKESEEIQGKISILEGLKKKDVHKIAILKELTNIIPLDVWLTDFSYREKENKVEFSGFAFSASNLISILEDSPLFEKVQFTSPIVKGGSVKENFRVEAVVTSQVK
jgi:general secretion pathway protein L